MKKVVFLGNPNVGKSALINALSDSHIKVGNWPGVTTEMIHANLNYKGEEIEFLDLPGIYHFGKHAEEKIATNYLLEGDYDLIINVIDSMNLERNLYLSLIARELQKPMISVLNFDDDVKKSGMIIDVNKLEKYLQVPVFKTSATKKTGITEVLDYIVSDYKKEVNYNIYYGKEIDEKIVEIYNLLIKENVEVPSFGLHFLAFRLFEKTKDFQQYVNQDVLDKIDKILEPFELEKNHTFFSQMQVSRYNQIENILKSIIDKRGESRFKITKKIDSIILNKWLGIPIFILFTLYFLTLIFNVSNPFVDWIDGFFGDFIGYHIGTWISGAPDWFQGLIIDGILGGIGSVLTFVPLMYFIYLLMAILEESGGMARIAFLMDRLMRGIGLNGKAFICLVIGFGCTVPAIGATRSIESEKARKATTLMLPFISCGARLPVYALFGAAFFSESFALVVASLYILGILVAICVGIVLKKLHYFDDETQDDAFTIELPPYRVPTPKLLFKNVNNRIKGFVKRVTTVIMIVIFCIWAFNYFPTGKAEESYLTKITNFIQPIFMPAGFGESKEAVAAIPTSIVAKEAVVATIGSLQGIEEEESDERPEESYFSFQMVALKDATIDALKGFIPHGLTDLFNANPDATEVEDENISKSRELFTGPDAALKAYSYMVFILLLVPCAVAIATVKKEFGTKFMWKVLGLSLIIPYVMSIIVYQLGKILFF